MLDREEAFREVSAGFTSRRDVETGPARYREVTDDSLTLVHDLLTASRNLLRPGKFLTNSARVRRQTVAVVEEREELYRKARQWYRR